MLGTLSSTKTAELLTDSERADYYLQPDNFYEFCVDVMGKDLEEQPHKEMCEVAESAVNEFDKYYTHGITPGPDDKNYHLILAPRDSFKSTVFNECLTVWLVLRYPNIRVLVDSDTISKAKIFVSVIRKYFEELPMLRALYGDQTPKKRDEAKWTDEAFTVRSRTKISREPSVTASGVGKAPQGQHFDFIIGDDWVSDKNVNTDDQIQKVVKHIQLVQSLLSPGGGLLIIGTRWHFFDPYGWIQSDPDQKDIFNCYIRDAEDADGDGTGKLYFPGRLTQAFLDKKKKAQGPYHYSCQYRNKPVPDGDQTFDVTKYQVISQNEFIERVIKRVPYHWIYLVDPAITEEAKRKGDYTAMCPWVITPGGNVFLFKAKAVREGANTLPETIYLHHMELTHELGQPYCSKMETISFQELLMPLIRHYEKTHHHKIVWTELIKMGRESKEVRIKSALPMLESRKIWIVEDKLNPTVQTLTDANKMLVDQALRFPMTKNDDMIDVQGYMVREAVPPKRSKGRNQSNDAFVYDDDDEDDDDDHLKGNRNRNIPPWWPK